MARYNGKIYVRFDVDMPDHAKIAPLSDAAVRCLWEACCWARKHGTDGFLSDRLATARWSVETLAELCANDDANPSLVKLDNGYQIHDYAEHQDTKAELEARHDEAKKHGQLGGQASAKARAERSVKRSVKHPVKRSVDQPPEPPVSRAPALAEDPYGSSVAAPISRAAAPNGAARSTGDPFAAEADAEGAELARAQAIAACNLCGDDGYRITTTGNPGAVCDHIDHHAETVAGRALAAQALTELRNRKAAR